MLVILRTGSLSLDLPRATGSQLVPQERQLLADGTSGSTEIRRR
jgi:hypothetical protein